MILAVWRWNGAEEASMQPVFIGSHGKNPRGVPRPRSIFCSVRSPHGKNPRGVAPGALCDQAARHFFPRLTSRAGLTTNQRRPRINYSSYLLNSSAVKTTACVRSVFMAPCQKENSARPFHASPTLLRNSQPPSRSFSFRSSQQPLIEFERGPMGTLDHVQ
jgi:hypothetical protein